MLSLTELNKKFKSNNSLYWFFREQFVIWYSRYKRVLDTPVVPKRKRILFYHLHSLGFAGTEKFLQILAKYLDKTTYDVFYMYPNKVQEYPEMAKRLAYLEEGNVIGIPFDYKGIESHPPYFVSRMNPDIKNIIKTFNIDLLVIADSGNANYPFSVIKNIPIILLNIFGQPNIQKNITAHLCISTEVSNKLFPIVPLNKRHVYPVPSEGPLPGSEVLGNHIREKFGIKNSDIVFGRIGRADNGIYDPIGIEAFKLALQKRDDIHYVIMAPPPILKEKVAKEGIKNVHFIDPSSKDEDVWAFHAAIDVLAHFRNDGESFGLNIVESMLSGKPIISHKSHIWNAHLEYLDNTFSRVSEKDDVKKYAEYLLEFADLKAHQTLVHMGMLAKEKAEKLFLIKNNISQFETYIQEAIKK